MTADDDACSVPRMRIVHVSPIAPGRLSGPGPSEDAMYRMQAAGWRERGYTVATIPPDGREHPVNRQCPLCSDEQP